MVDIKKPMKPAKGRQGRLVASLATMISEQANAELYSAYLYLAMSHWLEYNGYLNAAKTFKKYFDEEQTHMHKFLSYLQDRDVMPMLKPIAGPGCEYEDLPQILQLAYEHEVMVTTRLEAIAETAYEIGDKVTCSFMDWFLLEQIEEEAKFKSILDAWDVLSKGGATGLALMELDEMVGELA